MVYCIKFPLKTKFHKIFHVQYFKIILYGLQKLVLSDSIGCNEMLIVLELRKKYLTLVKNI